MGNNDSETNGRPRGVLTDRDRKYLSLSEEEREEEFSPSARSKTKRDIRERVRNAALDLSYLAAALDEELLNDVFAPERGSIEIDGEERAQTEMKESQLFISAGVEFLLRASVADGRVDRDPRLGVETAVSPFLEEVERGIQRWLNRNGVYADLEVGVSTADIKPVDSFATELAEREEPDLGLEYWRVRAILDRGGYSAEEIDELVGDHPLTDDEEEGDSDSR